MFLILSALLSTCSLYQVYFSHFCFNLESISIFSLLSSKIIFFFFRTFLHSKIYVSWLKLFTVLFLSIHLSGYYHYSYLFLYSFSFFVVFIKHTFFLKLFLVIKNFYFFLFFILFLFSFLFSFYLYFYSYFYFFFIIQKFTDLSLLPKALTLY